MLALAAQEERGQGQPILFRQWGRIEFDDRLHFPTHVFFVRLETEEQEEREILFGPALEVIGRNRGDLAFGHRRTGELPARVEYPEPIPRRMTLSAVAERTGEIRTASDRSE